MLRTEHGHFYSWALGIVGAAARRGWRVTVLASAEVEPVVRDRFAELGHDVVPFFPPWPARSPRVVKQLIGVAGYDRAVAWLRSHAAAGDLALTFSAQLEYAAAAAVENVTRGLPCPLVLQFFSWDHFIAATPVTAVIHRAFAASCATLIRRGNRGRFHVAGQTKAVAEAIQRRLGERVGCMPFPLDWSVLGDETTRVARPPVVGYLGGARDEKGFPEFVQAVGRLDPVPPIVAQTFRHPLDPPDDEHPARLERLRSLGATVVDHGLYGKDFADAFAAVDVVVLPYRRAEYAERNSSLLAEALGLGKVVVAPDGTWLGATLRHEGVGVTYDPTDPEGLTGAIGRALADHDVLRAAASASAAAWRRQHSPDGFLDALLEIAGEPVRTPTQDDWRTVASAWQHR